MGGLAPFAILQALLGGGNAVSSAPGVGVTTRLSTEVVQQNPYVESCAAFNTSYSDSGLFGVYGVSHPDHAGAMVSSIASVMGGLSNVGLDELSRAKAMLKGKLARQADDGSALMQDIGQQMLLSGSYGRPSDYGRIIEGVTAQDVS